MNITELEETLRTEEGIEHIEVKNVIERILGEKKEQG